MLKKTILLLAVLLLSPIYSAAEEVKVVGLPSVAFNSGNAFLNFGGPSVKIESDRYFGGLSFFPSLRHNSSTSEWSPILGAGLFMGRGNVFIVVPSYYYSLSWYSAVGIGYKF